MSDRAELFQVRLWRGDNEFVGNTERPRHRMLKQGSLPHGDKRFGDSRAKPRAGSGGSDNHTNAHLAPQDLLTSRKEDNARRR